MPALIIFFLSCNKARGAWGGWWALVVEELWNFITSQVISVAKEVFF